jgi:mevalonate kinase
MKRIINCETGEIIERELNQDEINQQKIDEKNFLQNEKEKLKQLQAKMEQKSALLEKLGITEDEAKLLLA